MMEVLATSIQGLTERLLHQSERQAVLLAALREFRAASSSDLVEAFNGRESGIEVDAGLLATPPSDDAVDEPDELDELDALWWTPRPYEAPGARPARVEAEPETLSADAAAAFFGGESTGTATTEAARERSDPSKATKATPSSKANGRTSSPSRRRRDYNYFADLEANLSMLAGREGPKHK